MREKIILIVSIMVVLAILIGGAFLFNYLRKPGAGLVPSSRVVIPGLLETPKVILPPVPDIVSRISGQITDINLKENYLKLLVLKPAVKEYKVIITSETKIAAFLKTGTGPVSGFISLGQLKKGDYAEVEVKENVLQKSVGDLTAVFIQPIRL